MSQWRNDILAITSSKIPISHFQWNKLLQFLKQYEDQLDENERQYILDKSEEYRIYLNEYSCSHIEQYEVKV